jgi:hypothetical protein
MTETKQKHKKAFAIHIVSDFLSDEDIWRELRIKFYDKIGKHFDKDEMIHADYISDAIDDLLWEHILNNR